MRDIGINLGSIVISLSSAVQLASSSIGGHQERVSYIVWKMAKAAGISTVRVERAFSAALLHDIGALAPEEKIALHNSFDYEDVDLHCTLGSLLLDNLSFFSDIAEIVKFHHTPWSSWQASAGNPVSFESQMVCLADYVERLINRKKFILTQYQNIRAEIKSLSGSQFFPAIVDLFMEVSNKEEFWLDIVCPHLNSFLMTRGPLAKKEVEIDQLKAIGGLFRCAIDFRSRFTATHSAGVAACASILARIYGFTDLEIKLMEFAGDIHDIGKMAVSTHILEKPGKLSYEEMAHMKVHPYYTYQVFHSIENLSHVGEWAASHHENLDGSGYPFRLKASQLGLAARILKVSDIFTALSEDRPYRKGMDKDQVIKVIQEEKANGRLDANVVKILVDNYDGIFEFVSEKQAEAREFYEKNFSFYSGRTNRKVSF